MKRKLIELEIVRETFRLQDLMHRGGFEDVVFVLREVQAFMQKGPCHLAYAGRLQNARIDQYFHKMSKTAATLPVNGPKADI